MLYELSGFEGCINAVATDTFGKRLYIGDGGGAVVECACKISAAPAGARDDGRDDGSESAESDGGGVVAELSVLRTCTELLGQPIASVRTHPRDRRLLVLTKSSSSSTSISSSAMPAALSSSASSSSAPSSQYTHLSRGGCRLVGIDLTIFAVESQLKPPSCGAYPIRMELSPDGRLLVCGSEDGRTLMWSMEANRMHEMKHVRIHNETVVQMSWHPTEHRIAACAFGAALPLCVFAFEAKSPVSLSRRDGAPEAGAARAGIGNNKLAAGGVFGGGGAGGGDAPRQPLMLTNRAAALQAAGFGSSPPQRPGAADPAASDPKVARALESRAPGPPPRDGGGADGERKEDWAMPEVLTPFSVSEMVARSSGIVRAQAGGGAARSAPSAPERSGQP